MLNDRELPGYDPHTGAIDSGLLADFDHINLNDYSDYSLSPELDHCVEDLPFSTCRLDIDLPLDLQF